MRYATNCLKKDGCSGVTQFCWVWFPTLMSLSVIWCHLGAENRSWRARKHYFMQCKKRVNLYIVYDWWLIDDWWFPDWRFMIDSLIVDDCFWFSMVDDWWSMIEDWCLRCLLLVVDESWFLVDYFMIGCRWSMRLLMAVFDRRRRRRRRRRRCCCCCCWWLRLRRLTWWQTQLGRSLTIAWLVAIMSNPHVNAPPPRPWIPFFEHHGIPQCFPWSFRRHPQQKGRWFERNGTSLRVSDCVYWVGFAWIWYNAPQWYTLKVQNYLFWTSRVLFDSGLNWHVWTQGCSWCCDAGGRGSKVFRTSVDPS